MNGRYYVGEWLVEPEQNRLVRGSESAKLDPKAVQVLSFLADHPNEVLTKERIISSVWDGAFVSDEVLTTAIWGLRKALGDDAKEPRYIQTIPRRGYRLIAPVEGMTGETSRRWEPSPYPGLSAFSQRDAQYFFGREAEVDALWAKLQERSLLGLIGPSGAGKSSLLRAGIIPACPEGWGVLVCQPRNDPFRPLEGLDAWRAEHSEALVIVDQFEELFTLNDEETQGRFAALLGRASESGMHVLLSMRDDFLIRCHDYPVLAPVFEKLTPVKALAGAALRTALVKPALSCGYRFEDEALVAEILTEVTKERGALPLVAFAASKLWEKRDREERRLTREAYLSIGGFAGALAQHAEETLASIGVENQPIVREIFRNLTTAQSTRVSSDKKELLTVFADRETAVRVLGKLIDARLLTSSEREVEIIHESLLSAWPRLVWWQAQDAEGAVLRDQLRQASRSWQERGQRDELLWTGTSYRELALWRERYTGGLSATEEAFADAATRLGGRRRRRRRVVVGALLAAAFAVAGISSMLWRQAEAEALRAEAAKLLALGQIELDSFPTAALAYATKSLELADTEEARLFAVRALSRGPTATLTPELPNDGNALTRPAFSPNGEWLALGGWKMTDVFHRDGRNALRLGHDYPEGMKPVGVDFGPGSDVLFTNRGGDVRVWSLPEGRELRRGQFEEGFSSTWTTDDGFVTSTTAGEREVVRWWPFDDGEARLLGTMEPFGEADVAHGWLAYPLGRKIYLRSLADWSSPPRILAEHSADIRSLAFSPEGESLAASDESGEIRIWATIPQVVRPLRILRGKVSEALRFDPTGTKLAGISEERGRALFLIWDLTAPPGTEPLGLRRGDYQGQYGNGLAFDPSGEWLATAQAGDAALWRLDESYSHVLLGHEAGVRSLAFTVNGKWLVSASGDGTVRAWPLSPEADGEGRVLLRTGMFYPTVAIDRASRNVVLGAGRGRLLVVPLAGGAARELEPLHSADSGGAVMALDSAGRLAASAQYAGPIEDRVIKIVDVESGAVRVLPRVPGTFQGNEEKFQWIQFLGTERLLATVIGRGLLVYNLKEGTGRLLSPQPRWQFVVSRDGRVGVGVTGNYDEGIRPTELVRFSLDGSTAETLLSHGGQVNAVALGPSETLVATGSVDGTVRIGPVSGDEPQVFFGHDGVVVSVAFSPDGRWLASAGKDQSIRLWPVPDLSKPPLHKRPYDDLLRELRSRTNLRVVRDPTSPSGWKLDRDPFPGWAKHPES